MASPQVISQQQQQQQHGHQPVQSLLQLRGVLKGHEGMVTSIATPPAHVSNQNWILSGSRDKKLIIWNLTRESDQNYGVPYKSLHGHSHFVQDITISSDGHFALSGSWDSTLRLWDLNYGTSTRRFVGHTKDVMSVAFSADNRQIVSGSRDKTIKIWNTLAENKWTIDEQTGHSEWVSSVRCTPHTTAGLGGVGSMGMCVSGGWDKKVKVWSLNNCKLRYDFSGNAGYVNTVTVSPDGSLCCSGGKDGVVRLWELNEGKPLYNLPAGCVVNQVIFSPTRYWLCAATEDGIKIWDVEKHVLVTQLNHNSHPTLRKRPQPLCIAWNADGTILFSGHADGDIRVWEVNKTKAGDFQ